MNQRLDTSATLSNSTINLRYTAAMRKRVQIALAFLLVAIAGVIAWQVLHLREPAYQGKRLSVWLQNYSPDGDSPEVDDAVRTMGTNVIPTLLGMLRAEDSKLRQILAALGFHYTATC